jgi:hypothetical protein
MLVSKDCNLTKDEIEKMSDKEITELFCDRLNTWLLEPAKQLLNSDADSGWVAVAAAEKILVALDNIGLEDVADIVNLIENNVIDPYVLLSSEYPNSIESTESSIKVNPYFMFDLCDQILNDLKETPEAVEVIGFNFKEFLISKFNIAEE